MKKKPQPIHIFVCGISNYPGSSHGWTDQAVTWCLERGLLADKFEYLALPLSRWVMQSRRIANLQEVINRHHDKPLRLIGHSNGCDIICHAIAQGAVLENAVVHLISPATEADCEKNGLNQALREKRIRQLHVHWGGCDSAMKWAHFSKVMVGWMGLGYGTMGQHGPKTIDPDVKNRVVLDYEKNFGHSTWFETRWMPLTMQKVTA